MHQLILQLVPKSDKDLLLTILCHVPHPALPPPFEGSGPQAGLVVAAQFLVMKEVPHEPDLRDAETVDDHELLVETGVECLKVGGRRRSGNPKGTKALMAGGFNADQLKAHSQEDVIDREQLHLEEYFEPSQ